jgi:hypothetical protein
MTQPGESTLDRQTITLGRAVKALALALALATASPVLLLPAQAAPPAVEEFDVVFPETSCGGEALTAQLHVRFTDKEQPDGTVHHFIDLHGTISDDRTGEHVTLRAARRFFDGPDDQSRFAGLQSRFAQPGAGVLHLNAGWSAGALTAPMAEWAARGRWDGLDDVLPPSVCTALGR